jgi:hypothetical protein
MRVEFLTTLKRVTCTLRSQVPNRGHACDKYGHTTEQKTRAHVVSATHAHLARLGDLQHTRRSHALVTPPPRKSRSMGVAPSARPFANAEYECSNATDRMAAPAVPPPGVMIGRSESPNLRHTRDDSVQRAVSNRERERALKEAAVARWSFSGQCAH